jgi:hypothetical protein
VLTNIRDSAGNQAALVFVHGLAGNTAGTWAGMLERLVAEPKLAGWNLHAFAYSSTRMFDLRHIWSADASIKEISLMLATAIASSEMKRYRSVALVGHSMGGLILQHALVNHPELRSRTHCLIMFATPSGGLQVARLLSFWKQQIGNLRADGPFIKELRDQWGRLPDPSRFQLITVAGEADQLVPPESSLAPFPFESRRVIPGNHLTMIHPNGGGAHPAAQLLIDVLTSGGAPAGPRNCARVAVELSDFHMAIDRLLPERDDLDPHAAVQLALALDAVGRKDEAMAVLEPHAENDTDAMGTLAGRWKRRWLLHRRRRDAERAVELYSRGLALACSPDRVLHHQAYYHGINLAFLKLALDDDLPAARDLAERVLDHCEQAAGDAKREFWRLATEGEAWLLLDRVDTALERYAAALKLNPEPWQALSSQEQAIRVADLCGLEGAVDRLIKLFQTAPA